MSPVWALAMFRVAHRLNQPAPTCASSRSGTSRTSNTPRGVFSKERSFQPVETESVPRASRRRSGSASQALAAVDEFFHAAGDRFRCLDLVLAAAQPRLLDRIRDESRLDEDRRHVSPEQDVEERVLHSVVAYPAHPRA